MVRTLRVHSLHCCSRAHSRILQCATHETNMCCCCPVTGCFIFLVYCTPYSNAEDRVALVSSLLHMLNACLFDVYRTSSVLFSPLTLTLTQTHLYKCQLANNRSSLKCEYSACEYSEASVNWDLMEQLFLWQLVNAHGTFDIDSVVPLLPKLNFRGTELRIERLCSKSFWRAPLLVDPCAECCAELRCPLRWHTIALLYCTLFVYRTCRIPVEFHADAEALSVCTFLPAIE